MLTQYDAQEIHNTTFLSILSISKGDPQNSDITRCHGVQVVTQRSENRERSDFLYWPMWPITST